MQKDILIMSCDVITDYPLTRLIQLYRVYNPTLIALMPNVSSYNETVPGRKGKEKIGQLITKLTEFQIIYLQKKISLELTKILVTDLYFSVQKLILKIQYHLKCQCLRGLLLLLKQT